MQSSDDDLDEILDGASVSSVSYIAQELLRTALASVVIPFIGPAGYGIIAAVTRISYTVMKLTKGVFVAMKRTVPRYGSEKQSTVVMLSFILIMTILLLGGAGVLFAKETVTSTNLLSDASNSVLELSIVFVISFVLVTFVAEVLKSYKEITAANGVLRWIAPGLQVVGALVAGVLGATLLGVLAGMTIALLTAILIGVGLLLGMTSFSPVDVSFSSDLRQSYASYLVPSVVSGVFVAAQMTSYSVLVFTVDPNAAGAFGIAMIAVNFARLPLRSVNQIFPQVATELYEDGLTTRINTLFQTTSKIALVVCLPLSATFIAFRREFLGFFSQSYVQFADIVVLMVVGHIFAVGCGTVGLLIMMTDNERENVWLQFTLSIITVLVAVAATTYYGIFGLAASMSFGFILNNAVEIVFLRSREGLFSFTRGHAIAVAGAFLLLLLLICIQKVLSTAVAVPVGLACAVAFLPCALLLCFTPEERTAILAFLSELRASLA